MLRSAIASALTVAVMSLQSGCHSPAGGAFPRTGGSYTYRSTEFSPKSVRLVDLRSGEVLFEMDVPVGRELTLDFQPGEGDDPVHTPDLLRYQVFDHNTQTGKLRNSMSVPNKYSRRIELFLRPAPEYALAKDTEELRIDKAGDRPAYWTPEGGPMPENDPGKAYDK